MFITSPDPCFFFLNLCQELLVCERLIQFLASGGCHLFQLRPRLIQKLQALNKEIISLMYVSITNQIHRKPPPDVFF